jgi:hypothetical protein
MSMRTQELDTLVAFKLLRGYRYENRNDTGEHPYQQLTLVFPDGTELTVLPERKLDGMESLGLYWNI